MLVGEVTGDQAGSSGEARRSLISIWWLTVTNNCYVSPLLMKFHSTCSQIFLYGGC
jgi:hypothetical protein